MLSMYLLAWLESQVLTLMVLWVESFSFIEPNSIPSMSMGQTSKSQSASVTVTAKVGELLHIEYLGGGDLKE